MSKAAFATKFEQVCAILDKYERDPHRLIAILQEIQEAYAYLPEDIMTYVATALGVTPGAVFGVATFYSHFTLEPKGKYVIKVCDGTACHVKKSGDIIRLLETELGLNAKKKTSDDMLFTLETVACLGACGLAPVVVLNEDVYGAMTKEKTLALLQKIREEEAADA
ncbi:MAG: NAD(P)H-dependent oxidoreductase subunit E [Oscillospiraceae bacterium]|jgi:NADH-quinone oxidoreductase subunit E|nr:NAD(P)H-dependent oxidoreductase subunit E [Oscillospiraceae bacterium]